MPLPVEITAPPCSLLFLRFQKYHNKDARIDLILKTYDRE